MRPVNRNQVKEKSHEFRNVQALEVDDGDTRRSDDESYRDEGGES